MLTVKLKFLFDDSIRTMTFFTENDFLENTVINLINTLCEFACMDGILSNIRSLTFFFSCVFSCKGFLFGKRIFIISNTFVVAKRGESKWEKCSSDSLLLSLTKELSERDPVFFWAILFVKDTILFVFQPNAAKAIFTVIAIAAVDQIF